MKRSESMLVYGVTAILVVIVGFAVVLGDETQGKEKTESLDTSAFFEEDTGDPKAGDQDGFGVKGEAPIVGREPSKDGDEPGEEEVFEPKPITLADLGRSTVINTTFDGRKHREVVVQNGDTFSQLVQTWSPGFTADDVLALNETLDPAKALPVNTTILMPFVDDQKIIDRHVARLEVNGPRVMSGAPIQPKTLGPAAGQQGKAPAVSPSTGTESTGNAQPATTRGSVHTVLEGEALWTIAARVVGPGPALDYCEQIKVANRLSSDTIRTGMKLKLP